MSNGRQAGFEVVQTREVYRGWTRLLTAKLRSVDGVTLDREIEDHGEAVCVLAYHPARKTAVLVRQMRAPVLFAAGAEETLETIAGLMEKTRDGNDAGACARREAMEEAHLPLDALEPVLTGWTMPGLSTERMHFFFATYSGAARPDMTAGAAHENESTIAVEIGLSELARMADAGKLTDVKTLLLVQTLRLRRPELF